MSRNNKIQTVEAPRFSDKQVGKRLSLARKLKKIPLNKITQLLKTSTTTVQQVEKGEKHIPNSWLPQLAANFKIDSHWVATGIKSPGSD